MGVELSDGVVVLHGIFRSSRSMNGLAKHVRSSGYEVLNVNYPSTNFSIQELVDIIHPQITEFQERISGKLHFVGYSMGGLLIRAYLKKHQPVNLSRVVMVGTPNHGSEIADFLRNFWLYKKLYGPAGQQLVTDQSEFAHIFADDGFELGVIAGNKPLDFISSRIIGKPNDGKVSIESTKLDCMKEHTVMPYDHTFFPARRKMWRQVVSFLGGGKFLSA